MKLRLLAAALTLAALGACAERGGDVTTPVMDGPARLAPGGPSLNTTPDTVLSFLFTGPNKLLSPGYAKYKVRDIVGGVGPYRYYWFVERCFQTATSCNAASLVDYGNGRDSIRVYLDGSMNEVHVTVQIDDLGSPGSGGETLNTLAPGAFETTSLNSAFCTSTPNYYPFEGPIVETAQGDSVQSYYARNTCNGSRIMILDPYYYWPYD